MPSNTKPRKETNPMNTFLSEWTKLVSTKAIYWTTGLFLFFGVGFAAVYGLDVPADPMVKTLDRHGHPHY